MNFKVYKSSAGSGKTYTLVKEYLKLTLSQERPDKYRHILAITFTNKAAAEMKQRVLASLKELAGEEAPKGTAGFLKADLIRDLNISGEIIRQRSARVLESMLHNYSDISISTIDKFTHRVIRSFARDLKIPLNFEVEMDASKLLVMAVDALISRVGPDEHLTRALVDFAESNIEEEKNWQFERDLLTFSSNLLKEDGIHHLAKLEPLAVKDFFEIKEKITGRLSTFEKQVRKYGSDALKIINDSNVQPASFAGGANGIPKFFSYLAEFRHKSLVPTNTVSKNISEDKWHSAKCIPAERSAIDTIKNELRHIYSEATGLIGDIYSEDQLLRLIYRKIYPLTVLNEIRKIIEEHKQQKNVIHISEFNKKIAEVVVHEPAPFIYERIGERYHHYLIDEFQDTSVLQWQNLLPLIDNALAGGNFNMLVGDGKQSIYRWRGGEVEQFSSLPEVYSHVKSILVTERELTLKRNYKEEILKTNYRSKAEIINFNNRFFTFLSHQLEENYKKIYHSHEQECSPASTGGYVQIDFFDVLQNIERTEDELYCEKTLTHIQQAIADGYLLKDIAVLCRTNAAASIIASYLIQNNIAVVSSESLLLCLSPKVCFVADVLNYIQNPSLKITQVKIARYLIEAGLAPEADTHESLSLVADKTSSDGLLIFLRRHNFDLNASRLLQLSAYEAAEAVLAVFGLNKEADPYLQFFMDAVHTFSIKEGNDIADFLEWWEEKKQKKSIVIPDGINAVTVMTIHKAKGLEFPVVIFPYANWVSKKGQDHLWINFDDKEIPQLPAALIPLIEEVENTIHGPEYAKEKNKSLLDQLNVLYVALTRPVSRLYIVASLPERTKKFSQNFINYLKENNLWQDNVLSYSFGEAVAVEEKKKKHEEDHFQPRDFITGDWRKKTIISRQAPLYWDADAPETAFGYGNLLHKTLSRIPTYHDAPAALSEMLLNGLITEEEKLLLEKNIDGLFQNTAFKAFFEPGLDVLSEAEILLPNGSSCRPDRVIINGSCATVVDFKTGKEKEEHILQLNSYANALKELGFSSVKKYLVYTQENRVQEV